MERRVRSIVTDMERRVRSIVTDMERRVRSIVTDMERRVRSVGLRSLTPLSRLQADVTPMMEPDGGLSLCAASMSRRLAFPLAS
jgi:hypothetical protein